MRRDKVSNTKCEKIKECLYIVVAIALFLQNYILLKQMHPFVSSPTSNTEKLSDTKTVVKLGDPILRQAPKQNQTQENLLEKKQDELWNQPMKISNAIFVHIGKTGGSSARCILNYAFREDICRRPRQKKKFLDEALGEGYFAIRDKTKAVIHRNTFNLKIAPKMTSVGKYIRSNNYQAAIVSIRDPVERMISWFLFTKNMPAPRIKKQNFFPNIF